ncbi:MAG: ribokinase [Chloroflexota bacterium]
MTAAGAAPALTVVGSTMIDQISYLERMPGRGETVLGRRFAQGFGGKGANQAVMASHMGARVAMVNSVGDDAYGTETIANLERHGVDTTHMRRVPGASGVAPIWVEPDGSNRIVIVPGANAGLLPAHAAAAIADQPRVDAVIGQFEIDQLVTAAAFRAARERGAITILNPAPAAAIDPELLAVSDWIIPNEHELAIIARELALPDDASDAALLALASRVGTRLVVTLGERGAALVRDDDVVVVPAPAVDVVDTTGAGDAFVGAFAYALGAGWAELAAVRLACAIASESVQRPGTQASFPDVGRCRAVADQVRATGMAGG